MRDSSGKDARLADACAGENENGAVQRFDRALLLLVQSVEIGRMSRLMAAHEQP